MKPLKDKLPKKLSALATLALRDLRKVEKDKRYKVDMSFYHLPVNGRCYSVCLAGAVIVNNFRVKPDVWVAPGSLLEDRIITEMDRHALLALNDLRLGFIRSAANLIGKVVPSGFRRTRYRVTPYEISPKQFHRDMRNLIKLLKEHKL